MGITTLPTHALVRKEDSHTSAIGFSLLHAYRDKVSYRLGGVFKSNWFATTKTVSLELFVEILLACLLLCQGAKDSHQTGELPLPVSQRDNPLAKHPRRVINFSHSDTVARAA